MINKQLDIKSISKRFDEILASETKESLEEWLKEDKKKHTSQTKEYDAAWHNK